MISRYHYPGWRTEWIVKSDAYDVRLMHYLGVHGTGKAIRDALPQCACGYIATGGHGHIKHSKIYDLDKLRALFPEIK